ncbi:MAG TPA: hypothetical protein VEL69_07305 [Ktedonobacteraceae bacterium]|nr:hypothetical protein [Ktedonobacteraceae bacterium]
MDNLEDERSNNEFEIEFTDLPAHESESMASSLLVRGADILTTVRNWYLTAKSTNRIEQEEDDNFEIEFTNLPSDNNHSICSKLASFSPLVTLRARLWRTFIIVCTLLLACMLFFSAFPSMRDTASGLFVRPTPTSTPSAPVSQWTAIRVVTELTPGVIVVGQKATTVWTGTTTDSGTTLIIWDTTALPGLPPQGKDCPARPAIGFSHQVGGAPVRATGFSGPYATLHLYPTPVSVPAFPNAFGWTASILFSEPTGYTSPITLNGADIHTGSPLLFQLDAAQDPLAFLTLDPAQPASNQGNSAANAGASWSVTMYFPAAGCYSLTASWPGGHWAINFAAGQ